MSFRRWFIPISIGAFAGWQMERSAGPSLDSAADTKAGVVSVAAPSNPVRTNPTLLPGSNPRGAAEAQRLAGEFLAAAEALVSRIAGAGLDDLPALFEEMKKLSTVSVEQNLVNAAIFQRWAELDPEAGMTCFKESGNADKMEHLGAVWLRRDAPAAMSWLEENPVARSGADLWAA